MNFRGLTKIFLTLLQKNFQSMMLLKENDLVAIALNVERGGFISKWIKYTT